MLVSVIAPPEWCGACDRCPCPREQRYENRGRRSEVGEVGEVKEAFSSGQKDMRWCRYNRWAT